MVERAKLQVTYRAIPLSDIPFDERLARTRPWAEVHTTATTYRHRRLSYHGRFDDRRDS
jgi:hypothetical protein